MHPSIIIIIRHSQFSAFTHPPPMGLDEMVGIFKVTTRSPCTILRPSPNQTFPSSSPPPAGKMVGIFYGHDA